MLKGVHRCGQCGHVELIVADPQGGPLLAHESPRFLGLHEAELRHWMHAAGAAEVQHFGGYAEEPYDRNTSVDLVTVAR